MLYVSLKRGLPRKFARFAPFRPIEKRSFNLLCVLDRDENSYEDIYNVSRAISGLRTCAISGLRTLNRVVTFHRVDTLNFANGRST